MTGLGDTGEGGFWRDGCHSSSALLSQEISGEQGDNHGRLSFHN